MYAKSPRPIEPMAVSEPGNSKSHRYTKRETKQAAVVDRFPPSYKAVHLVMRSAAWVTLARDGIPRRLDVTRGDVGYGILCSSA
jgi:hypothetical protein